MRSRSAYNGLFFPRDGKGAGHLHIAGSETSLKLVNSEPWPNLTSEFHDFHGKLSDGSKASLIDCIVERRIQHRWGEGAQYVREVFPNFIVIGETFINSDQPEIISISYHFENAASLLRGHKIFRHISLDENLAKNISSILDEKRERILYASKYISNISEISDYPSIIYFSGLWEIIKCATDVGSVSLTNRVSHGTGGSSGAGFENQVTVNIEFFAQKNLRDAVEALQTLHSLFELNLGRRQPYKWIELTLATLDPERPEGDRHLESELLWSAANDRIEGVVPPTSYADLLLDPEDRPEEFKTVTQGWVNSSSVMKDARSRFFSGFHSSYGINRIVGAANMFDLLPESRAPKKISIDVELQSAVTESRKIFKALPKSTARDSVLSAIGRVGHASLRDKVRYCADVLISKYPQKFSELYIPCDQAVLCRNHYIHGSERGFDYQDNFNEFAFITDTVEFVFAMADLINLGWEFEFWHEKLYGFKRGIGSYIQDYDENILRLKNFLQNSV